MCMVALTVDQVLQQLYASYHIKQMSLQNVRSSNVNTMESALILEVVLFATAQKDLQESIVKNHYLIHVRIFRVRMVENVLAQNLHISARVPMGGRGFVVRSELQSP